MAKPTLPSRKPIEGPPLSGLESDQMSLARPSDTGRTHADQIQSAAAARGLGDVLRENGLSLTLLALFLLFLFGQSIAGWLQFNETAKEHSEQTVRYLPYLLTAHFWEAVFENWESEFLQMAAYVWLTSCLIQKGSAESKKPPQEGENPQDEIPPEARTDPQAPAPVRKGGWLLRLYQRSLSLSLAGFFLLSFAGHAVAGAREYSEDQVAHGERAVSAVQYLWTSRFWFESLQNWQSEFLAVLALVLLSVWLREKGSPESKPVASPYSHTGAD